MKTSLYVTVFTLFTFATASAQYNSKYNKVWTFGKKAGLDFTTGTPVPITSAIDYLYNEGCASVSNSAGELLFYTDGKKVFNRDHMLMPNGVSIVPFETYSSTQGALIVPVVGSPDRYYVFSIQHADFSDTGVCRMMSSIVDMSLSAGYGDVVLSSMSTPIEDSLGEKVIAIAGNNNNIWLLTHRKDSAIFLAYNIDSSGIDPHPVVSRVGTRSSINGYLTGVIKASPNRRKLVSQTWTMGSACLSGTELYDFEPATGVVSNCILLDSLNSQYGAEFSPDNTKLYTQQNSGGPIMTIYQYDLTSSVATVIRSSKTLIATVNGHNGSDLKLAPDKKIYLAGTDDSMSYFSRYLDCIISPNLPGLSCGYVSQAIHLSPGTGIYFGLPNLFVTKDTAVIIDTIVTTNVQFLSQHSTITIFPNPATTKLTVAAAENITGMSISNVLGKEVWRRESDNSSVDIDISTLPQGVYFIRVNESAVMRFVKEQTAGTK